MPALKERFFEIDQNVREAMLAPRQIDLGSYRGWESDGDLPFHVEIDAVALLTLAEEAALGARVYEFLSITRPGDLHHYFRVRPVSLSPKLSARFEKDPKRFIEEPKHCGEGHLPFTKFDSMFRWGGDDTEPEARCWLLNREKSHWNKLFSELLGEVSVLQDKLRTSGDYLAQREIARLNLRVHRRDFLAEIYRTCRVKNFVSDQSTLPASLLSTIESLITRDDVRSVSCPLHDYWLWRLLVEEQLRRSDQLGRKPQASFWLSGSDAGLGAPYEDWGGDVHIPYEGACMADLFIQPDWRKSFPESDAEDGKLCDVLYPQGRGYTQPQCHYLLTRKDLGELKCARRTVVGDGWVLYESKAPYQPFRTDTDIAKDNRDD